MVASRGNARRMLSYFPFRYYAAAIFIFFILLNSAELINNTQEFLLMRILNFSHTPAFIANANLYIGEIPDTSKATLPTYLQLLFLGFFPIIAMTARTNLVTRARILGFGVLCFLTFVAISFAAIVIMHWLDVIDSVLTFRMVTLGSTVVAGSMIIELALFSTITIPTPTSLRPVVNRSYRAEYATLFILLIASAAIVYSLVSYLDLDFDSFIADYILIGVWLSMSSMITFAFFLSNLAFEVRRHIRLQRLKSSYYARTTSSGSGAYISVQNLEKDNGNDNIDDNGKGVGKNDDSNNNIISPAFGSRNVKERPPKWPFFVSFLIPAYNEEKLIGRCIDSIDRAAARYPGKIEIIIVNDGSTDNTEKVVEEAFKRLKCSSARIINIPNSGKGYALAFGLQQTTGDIIFRTDADSEIDEVALEPMMSHFKDPTVGSVCGWVFPLRDGKGLWWKVQNLLCAYYLYAKKGQDAVDSIIVQPGSSTAFLREAVMKAGGWKDNIFGEDGEITNRIARLGYRGVFEGRSIVYSEHPETLHGFIQQRARWGVAFFHSRGRNLRLLSEFRTPRSLIFFWNLVNHGAGLGKSLIWPFLVASIITGVFNLASISEQTALISLSVKLAAIQALITIIQIVLYAFRLNKVHRLSDLKFYPFIRLVNMLLNVVVKPQVVEVLLHWSTKWKVYDDDSFSDLRRQVNKSIDPLYPSGEHKPTIKDISSTSSTSSSQVAQQSASNSRN